MLIDNKLRVFSAKVFLPVTLLILISIHSGAVTNSGDSTGTIGSHPTKTRKLDALKSIGLVKLDKLKQIQAEPSEQEDNIPAISNVPVRFSGYVRGFMQYRSMDSYYQDMYGGQRNIAINGVNPVTRNQDGFPEPFMMLKAEANPTSRTSVVVEYYFDNQMTGQKSDSGRQALIYRLLNFKGNINSNFGTFTLTAGGGVNWAKQSPMTLWNYQYREDLFERWPWQPQGKSSGRYASQYEEKNIAVDNRWGRAGTQGFIFEGTGLPAGFGFMAVYGKTDNSGGFRSYVQTSNSPVKNFVSGRIYNNALGHEIGVNYFMQYGFTNAQQLKPESQRILTADFKIRPKNLNIYLEAGGGSYMSPDYKEKWSEAINLKVDVDKKVLRFPLTVTMYSIGSSVVNVNSNVLNSSVPFVQPSYPTPDKLFGATDLTTFPGVITELGQQTNNRRSLELQGGQTFGNFKFTIGYGVSQEIENKYSIDSRYNQVDFQHRLNAFPRSRFGGSTGIFQNMLGPYGSIVGMYRRTFERVMITDSDVNYKKSINTLDLSLKYKTNIFNKELVILNYTTFNSAQDKLSAIPVFSSDAFVKYLYNELTAFYSIGKKVTLVGFAGVEKVNANNRTQLVDDNGDLFKVQDYLSTTKKETGKSRDQFGKGFGLGIDYDFATNAGLFIRHRWFDHKDQNFKRDVFKGQESSVEIKIFF